jgi:nucleoside transporter
LVPWWVVLLCDQVQALCSAPTWGLTASIVLARLTDSSRQFGPVRAFGTLGWIVGCWIVSLLRADRSPVAMYTAAAVWIVVAFYTYLLPTAAPPGSRGPTSVRARLGLDALGLLRNPNHRVVFVTAALFAMPLAAFYPYAPTHLRDLGLERTTAWMSLGQVSEIVAMVLLAGVLARFPFKWTFAAGLGFGLVRYGLCALDGKGWVLAGVSLHGMAFTLFFITAQIYLEQRVDVAWRARAQALLTVMMTGVGNLFGYLGTGWWFFYTHQNGFSDWPLFWGGLAGAVAVVLVIFLAAYRRLSHKYQ